MPLVRFARERGLSPATLCRMNQRATPEEGPAAFCDRRMGNGRKSSIDRRALAWALCLMEAHPAAKLTALHLKLEERCREERWIVPSYAQVQRTLRKLPADVKVLLREGAREAFNQAMLVPRREETAPNLLWQLDFSEIPLWVRCLSTGTLYKPYLTAVLDVCTRAVVGFRVHRAVPNTLESLRALREALLPKGDERLPFFGVPVKIRTDHGSVYESADFLDALLRLDVIWDPAPQACPGANGKIERWFSTFSGGLLTTLHGFAAQYRGLSRAKELALPESVLPGLIQKYVVRYSHTVHSEIGCTPFERWMERLGTTHGLAVPTEIVEQAVRVRQEVTVERDGVHLYGLHFMAEELVGLVGEKVIVRVPVDITAAEVECFGRSGGLIGVLRPVDHDRDLAARINAARLGRTIEIQSLAKTLREIAGKASPSPAGTDVILPKPEEDAPIRSAPKLSIEE